jgi:hypothetical protein
MTRPTTKPQSDAPVVMTAPLAVPRVAPQRRWRPSLLWLAVAFVAVGGLIGWRLMVTVGTTGEYLAVVRQVEVGTALARADLTTVRITVDPALRPVKATRTDQVVGKHAAVTLVPGSLLTEAQLTDQAIPGAGQQLVGISLPPHRMPTQRVKPGATVLLVITTEDNPVQQQPQPAAAPPLSIKATVVDVASGVKEGDVLLNVAVPERDGPLVASRAAAGRIVVVLVPGG